MCAYEKYIYSFLVFISKQIINYVNNYIQTGPNVLTILPANNVHSIDILYIPLVQ